MDVNAICVFGVKLDPFCGKLKEIDFWLKNVKFSILLLVNLHFSIDIFFQLNFVNVSFFQAVSFLLFHCFPRR